MTQQQPWSGFKYEPVRGLRDRLISRYLRGQRKSMHRFFTERGLLEFTDRMDRIRKPRQGMMAKNALFQKVLDDYAKLVNPQPVSGGGGEGTPTPSAAEAEPTEDVGSPAVEMQPSGEPAVGECGPRGDAAGSVPGLDHEDGAGIVIEE